MLFLGRKYENNLYKPTPKVIDELADAMANAAKMVDDKEPCIVMVKRNIFIAEIHGK